MRVFFLLGLTSLFLLLTKANTFSQQISFKITSNTGDIIPIAYLKIYCDSSKSTLAYSIVKNGMFEYLPPISCKNLKYKITAPYFKEYIDSVSLNGSNNINISCLLTNQNEKMLDPVVVTAKSNPIQIKNDTTFYNIKKITDGTEKKLDEILAKLPGINVDKSNGEIRFKGKPIETVLIEGDNLFGENYTLGTKNINANGILEVQAIENYSDNYVLKGLEKEEKVALNIRFETNTLKLSGNTDVSLGHITDSTKLATDLNTNLIGLKQDYKFFTTISYNNLGINRTPIDYFRGFSGLGAQKENKLKASKYISDQIISPSDNSRSNINSQLFSNYNGLIKLTNRISILSNLFYIRDNIRARQVNENIYYINKDTLINYDITNILKKPEVFQGSVFVKYSISSKILIEGSYSKSIDQNDSFVNGSNNYLSKYDTYLSTNSKYDKIQLTYSQRISGNKALQLSTKFINSYTNQSYDISPSPYNRLLSNNDTQISNHHKIYSQTTASIHGLTSSKKRYTIFLQADLDDSYYYSEVINNVKQVTTKNYVNKVPLTRGTLSQGVKTNFDLKNLNISTSYNLNLLHQSLNDSASSSSIYIEPYIRFKYNLSKIAFIFLNYNLTKKSNLEKYIFRNNLLQNYRNVVKNVPSLDLTTTQNIAISYSRNDLFNQLENNLYLSYQVNDNDYMPLFNITDSLSYSTYSLYNLKNETFNAHFSSTKYISFLRTTIKLSLGHSINHYFNLLSLGDFRDNTTQTSNISLFYKTALGGIFNIENESSYFINSSKNMWSSALLNVKFLNTTKLILSFNRNIKILLLGDYQVPDMKNKKDIFFFDINGIIKVPKKSLEFKVQLQNILNRKQYSLFQVADFYKSISNFSVMPQTFLLSISRLF